MENKGFTLITTHEILEEYKRVVFELSDQFPSVDVSDVMDIITLNSKMTFSVSLPDQICEDPDDDKFISAALASRSFIIVSGDKHLLKINGYAGVNVFKPNEFLSCFFKD